MIKKIEIGEKIRGKKILEKIELNNGWIIIKTENKKSEKDFKVKTIYRTEPRIKYYTPKHAHFAIDLYGKICNNKEKAKMVFDAIIKIWHRETVEKVLAEYKEKVKNLPGYDLEYILYALNWILEQEDINFKGRPPERQKELDEIFDKLKIKVPENREGSQLAISLLGNIVLDFHPVEALLKANLDVLPIKRGKGAI
jgi:hypothetical protein